MYRSQLLLQQLGISQWIPRSEITVSQPKGLLWRDQEDVAPLSSVVQNVQSQDVVKVADQHLQGKADLQHARQILKDQSAVIKNQAAADSAMNPLVEQKILAEEVVEVSQTISFDCHLLLHEKFVLIAQIETEHEQRLFNQIVKACHASNGFIQWPLAIDSWAVNDDVLPSYLQGVFSNYQNKVCVILGELAFPLLEDVFSTQKKCASLQQLLESPQQKQALWQELYPLVYDIEPNNA